MKYPALLSFLLTTISVCGQQVISSSGNYYKQSHGSIAYTVGESVTETFSSGNTVVTQGFHQPVISVTALNNESISDISLYPNPSSDFIILDVKKDNGKEIFYSIYDMNGKLLESKIVQADQTEISLSNYAPASYIFKVSDRNKDIQSFKIVKQ
jgi:hypothetical protein